MVLKNNTLFLACEIQKKNGEGVIYSKSNKNLQTPVWVFDAIIRLFFLKIPPTIN